MHGNILGLNYKSKKLKTKDELYADNLYKYILKNIVKTLLGTGTTYSNDLERVGEQMLGRKFGGVYASDVKLNLSDNSPYAIINLDKSDEPGSHWIAVAKENEHLYCYDSFGRQTKHIIPSLLKHGLKVITVDKDAEQRVEQNDCGQRSISFLLVFENFGSGVAKLI